MGDQENEIIAGVGNEVFYFFGKHRYEIKNLLDLLI